MRMSEKCGNNNKHNINNSDNPLTSYTDETVFMTRNMITFALTPFKPRRH